MVKRWMTIKSIVKPNTDPGDTSLSDVLLKDIKGIDEEYSSSGDFLGVEVAFGVDFDTRKYKPCALVITLMRMVSKRIAGIIPVTHEAVSVASIVNETLTGLTTPVDGITLKDGDRVLVKAQTNPAENGIYVASATAWSRAADLDESLEVAGSFVHVSSGNTLSDTNWSCTVVSNTYVIGTDPMLWVEGANPEDLDSNWKHINTNTYAPKSTTMKVIDGEIDPVPVSMVLGIIMDNTAIIGINYLYKLSFSSAVGNMLTIGGGDNKNFSIDTEISEFTPGYYESFYSYPILITVPDEPDSFNVLRLGWNFPGSGYVAAAQGETIPSPTGHTVDGEYLGLLANGFEDINITVGEQDDPYKAAKACMLGLIPRDFTSMFLEKQDLILNSGDLLDSNPDVDEWTFEIQKSIRTTGALGDPATTDPNSDNILDDVTPDDNASDYNPSSDDSVFDIVYRGPNTEVDLNFENDASTKDIYFSGILMIKWSNRMVQLGKDSILKIKLGDPQKSGLGLTKLQAQVNSKVRINTVN